MKLFRLFGRGLVVDYHLLHELRAELARINGRIELTVEGTIMESAKVFEKLKVVKRSQTLLITVYASLPFWNRNGSPNFKVKKELTLLPGAYEIRYASSRGQTTFLKSTHIED